MKKTILSLAVAGLLTACGGGGGDTPGAQAAVSSPQGVACTAVTDSSSLDTTPVYKFYGLVSNWSNGDSVPGKLEGERFTWAVSNFSAVANEQNDTSLKSRVTSSLYRWAQADAYKGTRWCWAANTYWDPTCTQWVDPNGNDLSAIQDMGYVQQNVEAIRRAYSLISTWSKTNEPVKHAKIMEWLGFFETNSPPPDRVFFGLGMGRYHWKIQQVTDASGIAATVPSVTNLLDGILPLINDDGSIAERTFRGNRGMWYHYTSLNEIMTSMYLAKQANVSINPLLETRLHKAVELFLNTLDNPAYIIPWASAGFNNGGDGKNQNFNFANWYNDPYGGSWVYLYSNWYPNHANTARLKQKVPLGSTVSASMDSQFGAPLGCTLY